MKEKTAIFTVGRMNPPTRGHKKVIDTIIDLCRMNKGNGFVFLTKSFDKKRNPLSIDQKLKYAKSLFPMVEILPCTTVFDACKMLSGFGYSSGVIVLGEDRGNSIFNNLIQYIDHPDLDKNIGLKKLDLYQLPRTDEDYSATRSREYAMDGNFEQFKNNSPIGPDRIIKELFFDVRNGMGIKNGE